MIPASPWIGSISTAAVSGVMHARSREIAERYGAEARGERARSRRGNPSVEKEMTVVVRP
jgi:hypothetical protein